MGSLTQFLAIEQALNALAKQRYRCETEFWNVWFSERWIIDSSKRSSFAQSVWKVLEGHGIDWHDLAYELEKECADMHGFGHILCEGRLLLEKVAAFLDRDRRIACCPVQQYMGIKKGVYDFLAEVEMRAGNSAWLSLCFRRPILLDEQRFDGVMRVLERRGIPPSEVIARLQEMNRRSAGYSSKGAWMPLSPSCSDREVFEAIQQILLSGTEPEPKTFNVIARAA